MGILKGKEVVKCYFLGHSEVDLTIQVLPYLHGSIKTRVPIKEQCYDSHVLTSGMLEYSISHILDVTGFQQMLGDRHRREYEA